ncbi:MAG: hypothetical protein HGA82_03215 [Anaerolineales bacterium]|nr:hypothetical protein [Anaerolineales bacterium]
MEPGSIRGIREVVRQRPKDLRVSGQGVLELDLWLAAGFPNWNHLRLGRWCAFH